MIHVNELFIDGVIIRDNTCCEFRAYTHFLSSSNAWFLVWTLNSSGGRVEGESTALSPVAEFLLTLMSNRAEAQKDRCQISHLHIQHDNCTIYTSISTYWLIMSSSGFF